MAGRRRAGGRKRQACGQRQRQRQRQLASSLLEQPAAAAAWAPTQTTHRHCPVHQPADLGRVALAQGPAKHGEVLQGGRRRRRRGGGRGTRAGLPLLACRAARVALDAGSTPTASGASARRRSRGRRRRARLREGEDRAAKHGASTRHHAVACGCRQAGQVCWQWAASPARSGHTGSRPAARPASELGQFSLAAWPTSRSALQTASPARQSPGGSSSLRAPMPTPPTVVLLLLHAKVVAAVRDQPPRLAERPRVKQQLQPLPRRQLALRWRQWRAGPAGRAGWAGRQPCRAAGCRAEPGPACGCRELPVLCRPPCSSSLRAAPSRAAWRCERGRRPPAPPPWPPARAPTWAAGARLVVAGRGG